MTLSTASWPVFLAYHDIFRFCFSLIRRFPISIFLFQCFSLTDSMVEYVFSLVFSSEMSVAGAHLTVTNSQMLPSCWIGQASCFFLHALSSLLLPCPLPPLPLELPVQGILRCPTALRSHSPSTGAMIPFCQLFAGVDLKLHTIIFIGHCLVNHGLQHRSHAANSIQLSIIRATCHHHR